LTVKSYQGLQEFWGQRHQGQKRFSVILQAKSACGVRGIPRVKKNYVKNKIAQKNNLGEFFHLQKASLTL
jgi:hypothetical protein